MKNRIEDWGQDKEAAQKKVKGVAFILYLIR
jgi:hypothetical protein